MSHHDQIHLTQEQLIAASGTFELLSTPHRLHLVCLLAEGEADVSTLAERSAASIPATSQHLAKLRAAGVATARREGRRQLYRIEDPHILAIVRQMFSHIAPDGTLALQADERRPPRRPRFDPSTV
ncbi:ArsR/SmtB family transcription factor [Rathayibacter toxicus]|uniref:Transcriptional regulator n=1 Tax=Rathayibacter toxicus TaxID=145458 RepID=A0A0C5BUF6_9MICO|nr:metalloregulator ArsR/SmtB family transcription factor [Rathayibacter toxicus]AJM78297.1 ArsR family transcriptional regulator [Rathayibacter toxicus]ALS58264.1 ArsR family transcriptional regulator [Rathayibacter toxicus]KKM46418.1 ArsR family transcriptional regulator [Rathayibacter toxicus]PPG23404.1 transcriptional regulator [Rathayibacter toxicus]PPG47990.1 transcriptional regulator [Rathayibacter toxicus]